VTQQSVNGHMPPLPVNRIKVGIPQDHKRAVAWPGVKRAIQIGDPQKCFVGIAPTVAVFVPVENRGGGEIGQLIKPWVADHNRHNPVPGG
jgi:hypothetical protein